jgi:hypothetical protein
MFSLGNYLAQRFTPLAEPAKVFDAADLPHFRWPEAWKLRDDESEKLDTFIRQHCTSAELALDNTVLDAITKLDDWVMELFRKHLTRSVQHHLSEYLQTVWKQFFLEPIPDDFLWDYLAMRGETSWNFAVCWPNRSLELCRWHHIGE